MAIIYAFTFLDQEEQCPEKARRLFVTKDCKRAWTQAKDGGISLHKLLEDRVKHKTPLPPEHAAFEPIVASFERLGPIEAELALAVDHWLKPMSFWGGSGIGHQGQPWLRCKSDVTVRRYDQRRALMADWKSGRADYEKELQLEINAILLMANDPEIDQVIGMNVYLKTGKPGRTYSFSRDEISPRVARLVKRTREIDARDTTKTWEKRPGPLCPWCPVFDCAHYQGGKGR